MNVLLVLVLLRHTVSTASTSPIQPAIISPASTVSSTAALALAAPLLQGEPAVWRRQLAGGPVAPVGRAGAGRLHGPDSIPEADAARRRGQPRDSGRGLLWRHAERMDAHKVPLGSHGAPKAMRRESRSLLHITDQLITFVVPARAPWLPPHPSERMYLRSTSRPSNQSASGRWGIWLLFPHLTTSNLTCGVTKS